eukprot:3437159-Prymnesium_polylepis.1
MDTAGRVERWDVAPPEPWPRPVWRANAQAAKDTAGPSNDEARGMLTCCCWMSGSSNGSALAFSVVLITLSRCLKNVQSLPISSPLLPARGSAGHTTHTAPPSAGSKPVYLERGKNLPGHLADSVRTATRKETDV